MKISEFFSTTSDSLKPRDRISCRGVSTFCLGHLIVFDFVFFCFSLVRPSSFNGFHSSIHQTWGQNLHVMNVFCSPFRNVEHTMKAIDSRLPLKYLFYPLLSLKSGLSCRTVNDWSAAEKLVYFVFSDAKNVGVCVCEYYVMLICLRALVESCRFDLFCVGTCNLKSPLFHCTYFVEDFWIS